MTVGEAVRAYKAYEERRKDTAYFGYMNAMTVGLFIGSMFGSKPPTINDIYPEFFPKDEEVEETRQTADSAANFINFANAFNRAIDNGNNRKPESENNG